MELDEVFVEAARSSVQTSTVGEDVIFFFENLPVCFIKGVESLYILYLLTPGSLSYIKDFQNKAEAQNYAVPLTIKFGLDFKMGKQSE